MTYKIQLSLTPEEAELLDSQASRFGYNRTRYIKFLISREAFEVASHIPAASLTKRGKQSVKKALEEHKKGRTVLLSNPDELDKYV